LGFLINVVRFSAEIPKWKAIVKTNSGQIFGKIAIEKKSGKIMMNTLDRFKDVQCIKGCKRMILSNKTAVWEHIKQEFPGGRS